MTAPLRILMIVTNYSAAGGSPTMSDDLAKAFVDAGHEVQVIALQWSAKTNQPPQCANDAERLSVIRISPVEVIWAGNAVARFTKWLCSAWFARRHCAKILKGQQFDVVIGSSPLVATGALLSWAFRTFRARSFVHVVDFFPFHQHALGLIPSGPVLRAALRLETQLLRKCDVIGCMSPANIAYLRSHYALLPGQKVALLPIYGDVSAAPPAPREAVRKRYALPEGVPIVLFGGQITEGRGIAEIIETARLSHTHGDPTFFLLIGTGRLTPLVEAYIAEGAGNMAWIAQLPRDEYLTVATACDLGLVITVADVDVPTFPSKTIDYLRAGLPIIAAVEESTDYGTFVETHGFGHAITAGDPNALRRTITQLTSNGEMATAMIERGRTALRREFSATAAAETIIAQTQSP